jgi:hypothetical protein
MRLHLSLTGAGYSLHPPRCCPHLTTTCPLTAPAGWRYDGTLCSGHGDTGLVWECPLLIHLNSYKPAPACLPVHTLGLDRGTGPLSPSVSLRAMTLLDAVNCLPDGAQSSSDSPEADERCAAGWAGQGCDWGGGGLLRCILGISLLACLPACLPKRDAGPSPGSLLRTSLPWHLPSDLLHQPRHSLLP